MRGETFTGADDANPSTEIYRRFRGLIVSGQLGAGERLPTIRQAAVDMGVATATVAKAYKLLERGGFVVTRTAAGTRVSDSAAVLPAEIVLSLRNLVTAARRADIDIDDVVNALRATSKTQSISDDTSAQ